MITGSEVPLFRCLNIIFENYGVVICGNGPCQVRFRVVVYSDGLLGIFRQVDKILSCLAIWADLREALKVLIFHEDQSILLRPNSLPSIGEYQIGSTAYSWSIQVKESDVSRSILEYTVECNVISVCGKNKLSVQSHFCKVAHREFDGRGLGIQCWTVPQHQWERHHDEYSGFHFFYYIFSFARLIW